MRTEAKEKPGWRLSEVEGRTILARYDSAQTTDDNQRHWAAADRLSADASNNVRIRQLLRTRGRYETANNSYLKGIQQTLANDTIGTGPTLQMLLDEEEINSQLEADWTEWAKEIKLAEKLRIMRAARVDTGEIFAKFVTNHALASPIKLDVQLIEADQVTDVTWESWADPNKSDGIFYDDLGNPVSYRVLQYHPGSLNWGFSSLKYDDISARLIYHYFHNERAGQRRGIPDITPALSIFPDLRRYCAAVIAAAETAADYAMTIESDSSADVNSTDAGDQPEAMDSFELRKRMATVLPKGWKMSQTRAEQPVTTYGGFVDKKLAEAARCIGMPFTIAALDSSQSNLSARYLDSQIYSKGIDIDRADLECFLDRLLDMWLTEAIHVRRDDGAMMIPEDVRSFPHQFFWPMTVEHADPDKVASAQGAELRNGTTTLPRIYNSRGLDWRDELRKGAQALGISLEEYQKILQANMLLNPPPPAPAGGVQPTVKANQ